MNVTRRFTAALLVTSLIAFSSYAGAAAEAAAPPPALTAAQLEQLVAPIALYPTEPKPYHGYYYRLLMAQGPNAPGGAKNYLDAKGAMTKGFAMIAWPAEHGDSGVAWRAY